MGVGRVNWEREKVLLEFMGKGYLMPWKAARQLGEALITFSKRAEEWEERERIAMDAAILTRANIPFGITDNAAIKEEALKLAQHDRNLRRYMKTPTIHSGEVLGTPTVLQPRTPLERLKAMTAEEKAVALRILSGGSK